MAEIKTIYDDVFALTISLASLTSDHTNLLAGRESTAVDNGSDLYADVHISGRITAGTSPTAGNTIEVWAYGSIDDSPNTVDYPDTITGSDAAVTLTSANVKRLALRPVVRFTVDATSNRAYDFADISIARLFNGVPRHWGIVVINGSGVNLNSTGGNHWIKGKPQGFQVV